MIAADARCDFVDKRSRDTELRANFRKRPSSLAQCKETRHIGVAKSGRGVLLAPPHATTVEVLTAGVIGPAHPAEVRREIISPTAVNVIDRRAVEIPRDERQRYETMHVQSVNLAEPLQDNPRISSSSGRVRAQNYPTTELAGLKFSGRRREVVKGSCSTTIRDFQPSFVSRGGLPYLFVHGHSLQVTPGTVKVYSL